jgi:hypothetical protein
MVRVRPAAGAAGRVRTDQSGANESVQQTPLAFAKL